jgi:hypothetical protein
MADFLTGALIGIGLGSCARTLGNYLRKKAEHDPQHSSN